MAARDLRTLAMALALGLASLGAYADVLANDFVSFDDPQYILDNLQVRLGLSREGVRWAFTHAYSDNWHPLTWLSHMLDVSWFGLDPRGHHAMSAGLHAANAILLFVLLFRTTGRRWPSLLAAALFALHPLRVESVAWAAERKDVLSGFFFLVTLLAYVAYTKRPSVLRYSAIALLFVLGLLSKPMLVTLPIMLLLLDQWPLERSPDRVPAARLWMEKLPLFAISLASGVVTLWAQSRGEAVKSLEFISLGDRLGNAMLSVVVYLRQTLWPVDLAVFYPHPALVDIDSFLPFEIQALLAGLVLVAITLWVIHSIPKRPVLAFGWLWFLIMLAPVIGIVQVGSQAHADRYTYLPSIGLGIAMVFGLHDGKRSLVAGSRDRRRTLDRAVALVSVVTLALLATTTFRQAGTWRSSERLYQHALDVTDQNYIAAFNLGALAAAQGAHAMAIEFYRAALEIHPAYAAAQSNLGVSLDHLGQPHQAAVHFREALKLDPRLTQASINLGSHHAERGEDEIARGYYHKAIEARPDLALPREVLGELEVRLGRLDAAISHFESALAIQPGSAPLHAKLAGVLASQGREARAIEHYRVARALQPELLAATHALARLRATARDPSLRDGAEAVELAEIVNRATEHRNPTFLLTLALAHAQAGDAAEARRQRDRALGFAPADQRASLRARFDAHVDPAATP